MPLVKGQITVVSEIELPTTVETTADDSHELLIIDSNDELYRITKANFLDGIEAGFEIPTTIKTVAASGDYFVGIDSNNELYLITKANLLAGLSSGGSETGNTLLLLNFNGSNNSTSIVDSSSYGRTATIGGDAKLSTTIKKYGSASLALDGAGDYVTFPASDDWAFGTGDFTVETWMYLSSFPSTSSSRQIVGTYRYASSEGDKGWLLGLSPGKTLRMAMFGSSGSGYILDSSPVLELETWYHIAVTRTGSIVRLFLNGSLIATGSSGYNENYVTAPLKIGTQQVVLAGYSELGDNRTTIYGQLDDLRIKKTCEYTASFTPSTSELAA